MSLHISVLTPDGTESDETVDLSGATAKKLASALRSLPQPAVRAEIGGADLKLLATLLTPDDLFEFPAIPPSAVLDDVEIYAPELRRVENLVSHRRDLDFHWQVG